MAIEFRCSQCNQLLRVPETAAGKNARCPKCQALVTAPDIVSAVLSPGEISPFADVPGSSLPPHAPSPPPSFADAGNRLGESPFATAGVGVPVDSLNPYASPAAAAYAYAPHLFPEGPRPGLPWENEPRSIGCWFRTMSIVLGSPTRAFSMMRQYGGLGTPLLYNLYAVGMVMALVAMIVLPIMGLIGVFGGWNNNGGAMALGMAAIAGIMVVAAIFYAVMLVVVVPFIGAALIHVALQMVGGAKQGFETTFRVMCFGYYSALLPSMFLGLVPYLGSLGAMIWIIVVLVNGLSRAHEISGGKATAGVLLPIGLCCGLFLMLGFLDAMGLGGFKQ